MLNFNLDLELKTACLVSSCNTKQNCCYELPYWYRYLKMPKSAVSKGVLYRKWITDLPDIRLEGDTLFCSLCSKKLTATKRHHLLQHCNSTAHVDKRIETATVVSEKQTFFRPPVVQCTSNVKFYTDLAEMLIAANIPWCKLSNKKVRAFLSTYTKQSIPDESTLRKTIYQGVMKR